MSTVQLFSQISLAEAAYANLSTLDINSTKQQLISRLVAVDNGFSQAQAEYFADHWRVVNHQSDTSSGFSATLFESIDNPGEYTFAIRGTGDLLQDLVITDVTDIVLDGIALDQVVDMYNYWQRLKAPEGASYQAAQLVELSALSEQLAKAFVQGQDVGEELAATLGAQPGIIVDFPTLTVKTVAFGRSEDIFAGQPEAVGLKLATEVDSINVAGHSLGGHLAMAFTRLFEDDNPTAYTANGAGFRIHFNVDNLLNALAQAETSFDDNRIINLYGTAGLNFVTQDVFLGLNQEGVRVPVFTENTFKGALGHGIGQVTDSAVVYDLMVALDPALQALPPLSAINRLTPVFEAASNEKDFSVESVVNGLGKLLVPGFSEITESDEDNRETLYSRIQDLRQAIFVNPDVPSRVLNPEFQGLTITPLLASDPADKFKVRALGLDLANPDDAIAYRYALKELNPFVITGNSAIYEPHNQNDELALEHFTDEYLTDASEFLALKVELGTKDAASKPGEGTSSQIYRKLDDAGEEATRLTVNGRGQGGPRNRFIAFGGEGEDTLEGDSRTDRLYGNEGNDTLRGLAGSDHLEGNLGDDTLFGGGGNDTILGGRGDDTLYGVQENGSDDHAADELIGGAGFDTYYVGFGDIVIDSDGDGVIKENEQAIPVGTISLITDGSDIYTNNDATDNHKPSPKFGTLIE